MINIKEIRKQQNISQAELGKKVGVSTSAIGMYEQGRRDPDTDTLIRIAKALNVSMDYLLGTSPERESFDVEILTKSITKNLMDQPALMFNADCYTEEELDDLQAIIENSVRISLNKKLKN